jgi:hypothetical protein
MISPVEIARDLFAFRAARVGEDAEHVLYPRLMTSPGVEVLFQSQTEEKAAGLVDYAKCLHDRVWAVPACARACEVLRKLNRRGNTATGCAAIEPTMTVLVFAVKRPSTLTLVAVVWELRGDRGHTIPVTLFRPCTGWIEDISDPIEICRQWLGRRRAGPPRLRGAAALRHSVQFLASPTRAFPMPVSSKGILVCTIKPSFPFAVVIYPEE